VKGSPQRSIREILKKVCIKTLDAFPLLTADPTKLWKRYVEESSTARDVFTAIRCCVFSLFSNDYCREVFCVTSFKPAAYCNCDVLLSTQYDGTQRYIRVGLVINREVLSLRALLT